MTGRAIVVGVIAGGAAAVSIGAAQVPSSSTNETRAIVRLRVVPVTRTAPSGWWAESQEQLRIGESARISVSATRSLCDGILAGKPSSNAAHAWTAEMALTSASIDRIGIRVKWERVDAGSVIAGDTRDLVVAQQARYPIDFLTLSEPERGACGAAGASVEISADLPEPTSLAETVLDYEIWRTHEDGRGGRWTERTTASARQGERAGFWFTPILWPLPSGCDLAIDVAGAIRGRLREDGTIDMVVSPARRLEYQVPAIRFRDHAGVGAETGEKVVNVDAGRAVRFVLPAAVGSSNLPCGGTQAPSSGIDFGEQLKSHQTSIIVRPSVRIPNS